MNVILTPDEASAITKALSILQSKTLQVERKEAVSTASARKGKKKSPHADDMSKKLERRDQRFQ